MYGTDNIAKGPAMSREQAENAIISGIDIVRELAENDTKLILTGEMG
ncbi:MAG: nicotinate-nucleotide--dimethylbenzimidazole phosphoribosyltransferase, partial [Bacteroidales bacterium]|nr:nicotinate-nucleotide--dimethylbenzimidazole phosphoribosyltransferase [Bacteroidales bacterium]